VPPLPAKRTRANHQSLPIRLVVSLIKGRSLRRALLMPVVIAHVDLSRRESSGGFSKRCPEIGVN
jgi:hypothetical protein